MGNIVGFFFGVLFLSYILYRNIYFYTFNEDIDFGATFLASVSSQFTFCLLALPLLLASDHISSPIADYVSIPLALIVNPVLTWFAVKYFVQTSTTKLITITLTYFAFWALVVILSQTRLVYVT